MFTVPASLRDLPENQFSFTHDGETFTVPKIQFIPLDVIEDADEKVGWSLRQLIGLLEPRGLATAGAVEAVRSMDTFQIAATWEAWQTASRGVTVGESEASAGS